MPTLRLVIQVALPLLHGTHTIPDRWLELEDGAHSERVTMQQCGRRLRWIGGVRVEWSELRGTKWGHKIVISNRSKWWEDKGWQNPSMQTIVRQRGRAAWGMQKVITRQRGWLSNVDFSMDSARAQ